MALIPVNFGGGSGSGSDDCTAKAEHVLAPYTAITSDSDDEAVPGTLPDKTGWSSSGLAAGASVTIPKGYHDGNQKVTAKDLASQTAGTAAASHILKDKTAWVGGSKLTGTMEVSSVPSFSVAPYSTSQLVFTWKNPAQASGRPFSGVIIRWKTGSYPTSPTDGSGYMGSGSSSAAGATSSVTLGGFTAGTTYYFRIWAYCICSAGNYTVNSTKVLVSSSYQQATAAPTAHGRKVFTSSGTFTVPTAVRSINIHCTGGGGGGGNSLMSNVAGGGGAGGKTSYRNNISVTPGDSIYITVGAGAPLSGSGTTSPKYGGTSSAVLNDTTLVSAAGGGSAYAPRSSYNASPYGGDGGSGGGSGWGDSESGLTGGNGGSNGGPGSGNAGGTGQGSNTYEFGDSSKTLYAGGGGGGQGGSGTSGYAGGPGGGGNGGTTKYKGANGSAGTGGGGGADGANGRGGCSGGSGNVIITW